MSLMSLQGLTVTRRNRPVLRGISLRVEAGEFVGLLGPNGAGKSTLLEAALGLIPFQGASDLATLPAHARAQHAAYLPQSREIAWPVSVENLVALGRIPWPGASGAQDRAAIDAAISRIGLDAFRHRTATRLSGGEQARALIARALAQNTPLLLADEPIAGLDPAQQLACLRLFATLADEGSSILASLHDLGLAARFCTRLILLAKGEILADGPPETVLTDENLSRVFGIAAHRIDTPYGPAILPL
ncbi:ABC transporter ATP-binding protein [Paracoccus sp. M683]|uniref:ABC transporter ATP-binding protein n=1 Tax=Paracoccus sp. M683 TaxID=2594268 RepID=UPI00117CE79C|nr:ABC transporter ATP-binding protein [Paracoccus sp. M683]TRW98379.1 ABC transporter ATP-binding protein [Paracoccus sp. M683]